MTLRISEVYPSYQGEGPNTGRPTLFVRFAGCNLKCPGWPCDTPHAIDPKIFNAEMQTYGDTDKDERPIQALINDITMQTFPGMNICFTGGEVMLQPAHDLECLLEGLSNIHTHEGLELFTNGTFRMSRQFRAAFDTVVLDWKLPGSGEFLNEQYTDNVLRNLALLTERDAVKFTIANEEDLDEAVQRWSQLLQYRRRPPQVYCGVVWGQMEEQQLVKLLLDARLPWSLNVQVHKYVWPPDARRT